MQRALYGFTEAEYSLSLRVLAASSQSTLLVAFCAHMCFVNALLRTLIEDKFLPSEYVALVRL